MRTLLQTLPQRALLAVVRGYRRLFSPWVGNACRFEPTCSAYALGSLERHGAAIGTCLTLHRLARCHPLCDGGLDPVPERAPEWLRRFLNVRSAPRVDPEAHSTNARPLP